MNKPHFHVRIVGYEQINEIGGAWTGADYQQLLIAMDCAADDHCSEPELRKLCILCLQNRTIVEAAETVLTHRLHDKLKVDQIQNTAIELADEKSWEQFADISLHHELFHVGSLMFAAFPKAYCEPDAIRLSLEISSKNSAAIDLMNQPLEESLLVRVLADGMSHNSILHRLFNDQITGASFPESSSIVWTSELAKQAGDTVSGTIISSAHWLYSLDDVTEYESHALPDAKSSKP